MGSICTVVWLLLWDFGLPATAALPLILGAASLLIAGHALLKDFHDLRPYFAKEFRFDNTFVPFGVVTPFCCQIAWILYQAFSYACVLSTHVDGVPRAISGHAALAALALAIVAWLIVDLTAMETYTRHLIGVYLFVAGVLMASLVGCSSSSMDASGGGGGGGGGVGGVAAVNKVIIGVTVVVIVVFVCVKVGCCVEKMRKGRKYSLTHEKITCA